MRALLVQQVGTGPEGLRVVADHPEPFPAAGELVVAVHRVSAAKLELEQTLAGVGLGMAIRPPRVIGMDPAGQVVAVGAGVHDSWLGRRVAVKPNLVCGQCAACAADAESDCIAQQVLGVHRDGGAAELVAVPQRQAFPIAEQLSYDAAAASVHTVAVALHLLRRAGNPGPGDTVVVTGASGAVGSAAVALAMQAGATVVAAASSAARAQSVGADKAIGYEGLADIADAHVLVDTTGSGEVVTAALGTLGWCGRAVSCAGQPGATASLNLSSMYRNRLTLRGVAASDFADVVDALQLVASGRVPAPAVSIYPLTDAVQAYRDLGDRSRSGKVLLALR